MKKRDIQSITKKCFKEVKKSREQQFFLQKKNKKRDPKINIYPVFKQTLKKRV